MGKTWVWTYDDAGNITSRKEYAYTTGTLGSVQSTVNYTYDGTWGDLLTGYNGKTITSDTIGNMTSDGTWTYAWEHGRELMTMSSGSTTWTNTYNADGLRTKRTNGSTTYNYIYNVSSLSQMTVGSNTLYFAYDASGTPMSVTYNGTNYYYATNLQGDVTAILNTSGTAVVKYTYDAWGNILGITGTMAATLGEANPLRYRGYIYDSETSLYYLQSRYYDPEMGRFINADSYASTGQGFTGNNMFAYCNNNPINYSDPTGQIPRYFPVYLDETDRTYITDQAAFSIGTKRFGLANVAHGGCGAVATYNALITLGRSKSINDVLNYYNSKMFFTIGWGYVGLLPYNIVDYFEEQGCSVITTTDKNKIETLSQTADACIMYYEYSRTYNVGSIPINAYGAHFVEYHRTDGGYLGINTNGTGGVSGFRSPVDFGIQGSRYYVVGIFIFD